MEIQIVESENGDWQGLYLDGQLEIESHFIEAEDILSVLGLSFDKIYCNLENIGRCPDTFNEALEYET